MHIVIIFINIGDYHAARLQAAYQSCQKLNWDFTAIQVTDDTLQHSWGDCVSSLEVTVQTLLSTQSENNTQKDAFSSVACQALKKYLAKIKPDIIFIPGWSFDIAKTALKWCHEKQVIPILMSESNEHDAPRVWWKEKLKSWIVKRYKSALVGGQPQKRYLMKLGMPEEAIFLGYDVVGNQAFHPDNIKRLDQPHQKPFFLTVNRFITKKNLPFIISAYATYHQQIDNEPWDLILCGDGELCPQIEQQIAQLNLQDCIYLPGFLQQQEMLPYFAHAGCFIHGSTQEQWGLVVNEAMAASLPVLVSNRCGCYEDLVLEGVSGFGFDPYNSQQLTELMVKISSGKIDLKIMGQAALKHIQKFSPDRFAEGFMGAVKYALANTQ